ncbi:MAG: beta-ketoacyl synthase chain length factor [Deltaproteobacteria bacterium]|nr:beta-ketoacyl synthase chain length factor [Deltaproteobacteria bacterium]
MTRLYLHGAGSCALGFAGPFAEGPGQLVEIPIKQYAKPAKLRRYARVARLVYVAAHRAIEDAEVDDPASLAVVTSTAMGELTASLKLLEQIHEKRGVRVSPAVVPNTVHNAPAGHLTIGIGSHSPAVTVSQGWLSAEAALAAASDVLELGGGDRALVCVGDESDPAWVERLEQAGAEDWARSLEQEAFQEGVVALVVGLEPGGKRLGSIEASVERVEDRRAEVGRVIEALGVLSPRVEVRVRHSAGGKSLVGVVTEVLGASPPVLLDGPGPGSSQAGAAWSLLNRIGDAGCDELVLLGSELDDLGVLHWKR